MSATREHAVDFLAFAALRATYGACASWAVWDRGPDEEIQWHPDQQRAPDLVLNTFVQRLQSVNDQAALDEIGPFRSDRVLVALNFAERDESLGLAGEGLYFSAFHEEFSISSDHRLREACAGTSLWGGYLTDLVKFDGSLVAPVRDSKAPVVAKMLRDATFRDEQIAGLITELRTLGSVSPVIVAFGNVVFEHLSAPDVLGQLRAELGVDTRVVRVTHYSKAAGIKRDEYVNRVRAALIEEGVDLDRSLRHADLPRLVEHAAGFDVPGAHAGGL